MLLPSLPLTVVSPIDVVVMRFISGALAQGRREGHG